MITSAHKALKESFDIALRRTIKRGGFTFVYPDGSTGHYGESTPGHPGPTLRLSDWLDIPRLALNPSLSFGDAFTAGRITCDSDADLEGFVSTAVLNSKHGKLARAITRLRWRPSNFRSRQRDNIAAHYDGTTVSPEHLQQWYRWVLGKTMLYTCARYVTGDESLEAAQIEKIRDVGLKLGLTDERDRKLDDRSRILEVGAGWDGYMLCWLAEQYGVRGLGISISREQVEAANQAAKRRGLDELVKFRYMSYQDLAAAVRQGSIQPFQAGYSIGMFEHVAHSDYAEYMQMIADVTEPEARFLLHCIGNRFGGPPDPFIARRIFPGSRLGSVSQMTRAMELVGLELMDYENLCQHYVPTLQAWIDNHNARRGEITELLGPEFERQRRYWLIASKASFAVGELSLNQFLLTNGKPQPGTYPWSRAGLYRHLGKK